MKAPPFILLCNPEGRRVALFQAALTRFGLPPAVIVSWHDFIADASALTRVRFERAVLRIDSPGENSEVERALLARGFARAVGEPCQAVDPTDFVPGQIPPPRQLHFGFESVLDDIDAVLRDRPDWRVPTPPDLVRVCFDKGETWRRCVAHQLPVPEALEAVSDLQSLLAAMAERAWDRVFIKVSCASSASCLALLSRQGPQALTTVEMTDAGYFNSLRLRTYGGAELERLVAFLLGEGAHIERAIPKARLGDGRARRYFDLRVLVIAREAAFTVVRQNRHPITNLHLGGGRGDLDAVKRLCTGFDALCRSATRLADTLGAFQLGVDVLIEPDMHHHRILEANAFGDLLPNLSRDGEGVYDRQVRRLVEGGMRSSSPSP